MNAYTERLLGLVGDREPLHVLAETPPRLADLFRALEKTKLSTPFGEGKWTARQVLGHLVDVECAFSFRVRLALTVDHPTIQPYDQDAFIALYRGVDGRRALDAFCSLRTWNLALLRSLDPAQLARGAYHPERGEEPVGRMIALTAGHDLNHLAQLEAVART